MSRVAIANYDKAVRQLSAASQGLYAGPRYSTQALEKAMGATQGLNTGAIKNAAQAATGKGVSLHRWGPLVPVLVRLLEAIAASLIATFLANGINSLIGRWFGGSDLADETDRATDDIDKIEKESGSLMEDASSRTLDLMDEVVQLLNTALEHPDRAFAQQFVDIGSNLIDTLAEYLLGTSQERDQGIQYCLDTLCSSAEKFHGTYEVKGAPGAQQRGVSAAPEEATMPGEQQGSLRKAPQGLGLGGDPVPTAPASVPGGAPYAGMGVPIMASSTEPVAGTGAGVLSALSDGWSQPPTTVATAPAQVEAAYPAQVSTAGLAPSATPAVAPPGESAVRAQEAADLVPADRLPATESIPQEDPWGLPASGQTDTPATVPIPTQSVIGLALVAVGIGMVVDFLHAEVKKAVEQYFAFLSSPADIPLDPPVESPAEALSDTLPVANNAAASPDPAPTSKAEPTPAPKVESMSSAEAAPAAGSPPPPEPAPKPVVQAPAAPPPTPAPAAPPPVKGHAAPPPAAQAPSEPVQKSHLRRAGAW